MLLALIVTLTQSARAEPFPVRDWRQARELLREHNPRAQLLAAMSERAVAAARAAFGPLLPQLGAQLGGRFSPVRPVFVALGEPPNQEWFGPSSLAVHGAATLRYTLSALAWAAYAYAQRAAQVEQAAEASARHADVEVLASVLLTTLATDRLAERQHAGARAAEQRLALAQRLLELGKATLLDVQRFTQDLNATRRALLEAEETAQQAREALGELLGLGRPATFAPLPEADALVTDAEADCEALQTLSQRADMSEASARVELARASVESSQLAFLPELRIDSSYTLEHAALSPIPSSVGRGFLHDWRVGATLVWSAFDGGTRQARVDAARAELTAARSARRGLELSLRTQASRSERSLTLARQRLQVDREDLASAELTDSLSRRGLELGTGSALEAVDAARRLRFAELAVAADEVELAIAALQAKLLKRRCR